MVWVKLLVSPERKVCSTNHKCNAHVLSCVMSRLQLHTWLCWHLLTHTAARLLLNWVHRSMSWLQKYPDAVCISKCHQNLVCSTVMACLQQIHLDISDTTHFQLWLVSGFCANSVLFYTSPALYNLHTCHKQCEATLIVAPVMINEKHKLSFCFAYLDSGLVLSVFRYWSVVIWWQQVDVRQPSWAQSPEVSDSSRVV